MPGLQVQVQGLPKLQRLLTNAPQEIRERVAIAANDIGAKAVNEIKLKYRSGGGTESLTTRSGETRRAYGHRVKKERNGTTLTIGGIKKTARGGHVPPSIFVHDGLAFKGIKRLIIRAKQSPFMVFPDRRGSKGGLSQRTIKGWIKTKQVVLPLRPALPQIMEFVDRELNRRVPQIIQEALSR